MARKTQQKNVSDETCPRCEAEVRVPNDRVSLCPECGWPIRPCSMCHECQGKCPWGDDATYALYAEDVQIAFVQKSTDQYGKFQSWRLIDRFPRDVVEENLNDAGLFPRESPKAMALARCTAHYICSDKDHGYVPLLMTSNADYYRKAENHPAVMAICHALCTLPEEPTESFAPGHDNFSIHKVSTLEELWLVYGDEPLCQAYADDVGWRLGIPIGDVADMLAARCPSYIYDMEEWLEDKAEMEGFCSVAGWVLGGGQVPSSRDLTVEWLRGYLEALPDFPEGMDGDLQIVRLGAAE